MKTSCFFGGASLLFTLCNLSVTLSGQAAEVQGAQILNVDFGVGTTSPKTGVAATGQGTNDYWNLYSRDDGSGGYRTVGSVSNLKWADGTASGVGVTVENAPGAWHNGAADPMYDVYLYPLGGGKITVTVTGVPAGSYDLYLYGHGGPGADLQNSVFEVLAGGTNYGNKATTTNSNWNSSTWQEGVQYVVFHEVAIGGSGSALTVSVLPGASGYAIASGMQIVQKSVAPPPPLPIGPVLNLDLGIGTTSPKTGLAATGQGPSDYWNLYSRDDGNGGYRTVGAVGNLKWADGTASGVGVTVQNAPGAWHNGAADPMYDLYLYPLSGGNITVTVTNMPAGSYDLYLYGHGGPGADLQNSVFEVLSGGTNYGSKATTTNSNWNSPTWQEGVQYVVFHEVAVGGGGRALTVRVLPGASGYAIASGMQIVQKSVAPPPPPPVGPILNLDFGIGTSSPKTGLAATGQGTNDYWNLYSRDDGTGGYRTIGSVSNLKWADRTESGAGVTVENAPGAWLNGAADPMYDVYLYPLGGGNITVTVTNVPAGSYDLYLYGHGGPGADLQNSVFEVLAGGTNYGTKGTTTNSNWNSPTWQEGVQYVVFRQVTIGASGAALTVRVLPGASGYAIASGMQIVQKSVAPPPPPPVGPFVNGSFELPPLGPGAGVDLAPGTGSLTGWTVGRTGLVSFRNGPANGVAPVDGTQEIGFNGADTPVGGSVWQTFTTTPGQAYRVRFNVGRQGTGAGTMRLHAEVTSSSGQVLGSVDAEAPASPGYGAAQGFDFTAAGDVSTLTFRDTSTATLAVDVLLDNVTVTPLAECLPAPDGLVDWLPGNGNANDAVSGGTAVATGITFSEGRVGQAFHFNGADSKLSLGSSAGNFGTNDFTIDFWIRTTSTRLESVMEKWPVCGMSSMWNIRIGQLGSNSGHLNTEMMSSSAGDDHTVMISGRAINDGVFHHVAFVRSGRSIAYYIDGTLDVSSESSGGVTRIQNTADFSVGRSVCVGVDGTAPFTGEMDEIDVFSRALGANEIASIYNAGAAGKCHETGADCAPAPNGLVDWLPGNGNANDVVSGGTAASTGITFSEGRVGQAFHFNGADSKLSLGSSAGNFGTNDFTIDFWIRTTSTRLESVMEKWPVCGMSSMWNIRIGQPGNNSGHLNTEMMSSSAGDDHSVMISGRAINDGAFHHVAFVRRGRIIAYYIDGALDVSSESSGGVTRIDNTADFSVGRSVCVGIDGTSPFTGEMDEIDVFSRALAADEIASIYRAGAAGKCHEVPARCVPAPDGLVSWWPAAGNAADVVGGNNGSLRGNAGYGDGEVGQAFTFDGSGDGVLIGNPASLRLQSFTIEGWIKRASTTQVSASSIYGEIVGYGWGGYVFGFLPGGNLFLSKHGISYVGSVRTISDTAWHHVAVSRSGSAVVFYIDGAAEAPQSYGVTFDFSTDLLIGAVNSGVEASFLGSIDELSIYNRALTGGEVQTVYSAGHAGKCLPPPPQAKALAHWKFDEASGTVAHDSAGTFNGTLSPTGAGFVAGGISGGAVSLSRINHGFVTMGNVLGLPNTDYSIVAWIKMTAGDISNTVILSKHAAYTRNGYLLGVNKLDVFRDNTASFIEGGSGVAAYTVEETPISTTAVNDGKWHQVVGVYQAGGMRFIYVDGAPAEDGKLSQPFNQNDVAFLIGGANYAGTPAGLFDGLIDEVQVYNYALGDQEVDFLFNNPGQEIAPHDLPPAGFRLNTLGGPGGAISRTPDLAVYTNGATVKLTAVPSPGYAFAGWTGDADGTNNPITITMNGSKTVSASFKELPVRILSVVDPEPRQEGARIPVLITLTSPGDVGGMSFILRYDPAYLRDPDLEWLSAVGSALNQANYEVPGQVRATFALPATAVPPGTQAVANVTFRARSVPATLSTALGLEIVDASKPTGDPITSGSSAKSGSARILVRRVLCDNNANDRLDVGDASIIQRFLTGLDPVRSWDVSGNDMNANARLDSGDVIKVLRAVVGLDPQPQSSVSPAGATSVSGGRIALAGGWSEMAVLSLDHERAQPGDLATLQVRLNGIATGLSGVSFALDYPTNALRLLNAQSERTGELVPAATAVTVWNVEPAQNDFILQSGSVSAAISSPGQWPTNNGVLAEFTFQVQAGQAAQYRWPIRLRNLEVSDDGYDVRSLADAVAYFFGGDSVPPSLWAPAAAWTPDGLVLTLTCDAGLSYTIEVSTDLKTWSQLSSLTATTGVLNIVDPDAKHYDHRYYRAVQLLNSVPGQQ